MENPLISIVIPCYDHGQYIDEAIKSVEEYDNDDFEIIIINDGSTDDYTNKRLLELKNEGYNVIFQENQGVGRTRNNGIRMAKGKYILPLDADNKIKPEYINKALEILKQNSNVSIVYSDQQLFGDLNGITKVGEFNIPRIFKGNYIDACAIYKKIVWEEIGGYDEKMPFQGLEDWDFWISAAEKGFEFSYISKPLYYYRIVENSMMHKLNNNNNSYIVFDYIYNKHLKLQKNINLWLINIFIPIISEGANSSLNSLSYSNLIRIIKIIRNDRLGFQYEINTWYYFLLYHSIFHKKNLMFIFVLIKKLYLPKPFRDMKILRKN